MLASSAPPAEPPAADRTVPVLVPLPLPGTYDYLVPDGLHVAPGDFVEIPLGSRRVIGVVWDPVATDPVPLEKLRPVLRRIEAPAMRAEMRQFVLWVAAYTLAAPGAVLRMAMSAPAALEPPPPATGYRLSAAEAGSGLRRTPARERLFAFLGDGLARPLGELTREAGVSPGVVHGLVRAGLVEAVALPPRRHARIDWRCAGPPLSAAQLAAADVLRSRVAARSFSVTLLDGVTGSGKTEVYFEAIAAALDGEAQVLVLVPEIALTGQWLDRFRHRFGAAPAEWHSEVTAAQRRDTWRGVAEGRVRVVVAARSGLFLPFRELGLIVVDEEHDAAFKQEDGVAYQARDMSVVRARIESAPAVLVSATPSLETLANVDRGRYAAVQLPERHGGATLPRIEVLDLRRRPPPRGRWLAPPLAEAVAAAVRAGEQALVFLNRRGYAPLTLCRTCGHRFQCPNCSAWLVAHRFQRRLQCHHCGFSIPEPAACPACGEAESLVACGPGVERIAEELALLLPDARLAVMTSDTLTGPQAAVELLRRVAAREVDILVGTQMVAKGHHFPLLTVVGVIDADLGLAGGDLRAAERTFQLLWQVSGRAGRASRPGQVFLQTYDPANPVIRALAAHDREAFVAAEKETRRRAGMPPYGRLAAVIVSAPDPAAAEQGARILGRAAPVAPEIRVLGPAPAPLALLRGRHRWRLLVKVARDVDLQTVLRRWIGGVRVPASVRIQVDVDPYSFS